MSSSVNGLEGQNFCFIFGFRPARENRECLSVKFAINANDEGQIMYIRERINIYNELNEYGTRISYIW